MESSSSAKNNRVKSWFGLFFGAVLALMSALAWARTGALSSLVSAAAFGCFAVVWSKMPLSLTTSFQKQLASSPPMSRGDTFLMWTAFVLLIVAVALRWLL